MPNMGRAMAQEREEKMIMGLMELSYLNSSDRKNISRIAICTFNMPLLCLCYRWDLGGSHADCRYRYMLNYLRFEWCLYLINFRSTCSWSSQEEAEDSSSTCNWIRTFSSQFEKHILT